MQSNIIIQKVKLWSSVVKFSHSVFALPFALSMCVLATKYVDLTWLQLILIILSVISARTAAMGYNRLVDRFIDSKNPRTNKRELPSGAVQVSSVWNLIIISTLIFLCATWGLGLHCLILAPFVLCILFIYSWTKHFSAYSHLVLGFALGLAPGGVWYALTERISYEPLPLMAAVLFWVAGFDILYALQDLEFDKSQGLFSIAVRFGKKRAFQIAKIFHLIAVCLLAIFGLVLSCGAVYYCGVVIFGLLLASQYQLISPTSLERINQAFFVSNGMASLFFFLFVVTDTLI